MSAILAASVLVLVFFAMLALPLTPACRELLRKTDHEPLKVVQQHAGDVRFFADGFRHYLAPIAPNLDESDVYGSDALIVMPDGIPCLVLAKTAATHDFGIDRDSACTKMIASLGDLELPAGVTFERDIYARQQLRGGADNRYRALLGESAIQLAEESVVMRWVHAVGELECANGCRLYGRVSSERSIRLDIGCRFTRVHAPHIVLGPQDTAGTAASRSEAPDNTATEIVDRVLHEGDLAIAPGEVFTKHLVVRGELRIGAGARMLGNVKAQKTAILDSGVIAHGSLISATALKIGPDCRLRGPVIAEHAISIQPGTQVGSSQAPTTVSAPTIDIAQGVVVCGTLWARDQGRVVDRA